MAQAWSNDELDVLMEAYHRMLRAELSGNPFVKASENRAVQQATGRSKGSVEYKFCNLSAVLIRLGYPIVEGYRPRNNYQASMLTAAEIFFSDKGLNPHP